MSIKLSDRALIEKAELLHEYIYEGDTFNKVDLILLEATLGELARRGYIWKVNLVIEKK